MDPFFKDDEGLRPPERRGRWQGNTWNSGSQGKKQKGNLSERPGPVSIVNRLSLQVQIIVHSAIDHVCEEAKL